MRRFLGLFLLLSLMIAAVPAAAGPANRWIYALREGATELGLSILTIEQPTPTPGTTVLRSYSMYDGEQPQRTIELTLHYLPGERRVESYTRRLVTGGIQATDTFVAQSGRGKLIKYLPPWPPLPFDFALPEPPWLPLEMDSIASWQLFATMANNLPAGADRLPVFIDHVLTEYKVSKGSDEQGDVLIRATAGSLQLTIAVERLTGIVKQVEGLPWDRKMTRVTQTDFSPSPAAGLPANTFEVEEIAISASGAIRLQSTMKRPPDVKSPPLVIMIDDVNCLDPLGRGLLDDLGSALAKRGIASIMYNQRGVAGSAGDFEFITMDKLASDAEAVLSLIKSRADVDVRRIGLLGYGIGGFTALTLAARHSDIRAVVGMATLAVRPFPTLLNLRYRQQAQLLGWSVDDLRVALAAVEASSEAVATSSGDWLQYGGRVYPAAFARSAASLNIRESLAGLACPVLLIHGTQDLDYPFQQMNDLKDVLMETGAEQVDLLPVEGGSNDLGPWIRLPQSAPLPAHRYAEPQLKKQLITWLEQIL